MGVTVDISIHVPRVGDDNSDAEMFRREVQFQSTSPVWGTTSDRQPLR